MKFCQASEGKRTLILEFVIMTFLEMAIVNIFKGRSSEPRLYETPSKAFIICILLVCLLQ